MRDKIYHRLGTRIRTYFYNPLWDVTSRVNRVEKINSGTIGEIIHRPSVSP